MTSAPLPVLECGLVITFIGCDLSQRWRGSPAWSGSQTKVVTSHRTSKDSNETHGDTALTVVLIEQLEQMRCRELADLAADCGTHLRAVAPVHPTQTRALPSSSW